MSTQRVKTALPPFTLEETQDLVTALHCRRFGAYDEWQHCVRSPHLADHQAEAQATYARSEELYEKVEKMLGLEVWETVMHMVGKSKAAKKVPWIAPPASSFDGLHLGTKADDYAGLWPGWDPAAPKFGLPSKLAAEVQALFLKDYLAVKPQAKYLGAKIDHYNIDDFPPMKYGVSLEALAPGACSPSSYSPAKPGSFAHVDELALAIKSGAVTATEAAATLQSKLSKNKILTSGKLVGVLDKINVVASDCIPKGSVVMIDENGEATTIMKVTGVDYGPDEATFHLEHCPTKTKRPW